MKRFGSAVVCTLFVGTLLGALASSATSETTTREGGGWVSLFNGKNLDGWKASENIDSFKVVDGEIVIHGPRSHLFYVGPINDADFTNFEWKCEVLLKPHANSGMYFHTQFQEQGWPSRGYEVQLNNTHSDRKKTGGLYAISDRMDNSPAVDDEWFTQHVIVRDKRIVIKVNDEVITDYEEPTRVKRPTEFEGRLVSHGTLALQAHDPNSEARIRKILVRPLP